ncbi:MAG: hypothetical protein LUQ40_00675 [Methanomicrobiales archaeon]|nr:hypothetical protein [Methanomicrobiales archaeon]
MLSPKFQDRVMFVPEDWSVNWTATGAVPPVILELNAATGGDTGFVTVWLSAAAAE